MKRTVYPPLNFAQMTDVTKMGDNNVTQILQRILSEDSSIMNFLYDENFMDPLYKGKYDYINKYFFTYHRDKLLNMGTLRKTLNDAINLFSMCYIATAWARNKQVYKFDKELESSLIDNHEIRLPIRILDRLPYDVFYIEFADDGILKSNCHGAFIQVVPNGKGYVIHMRRIKNDCDSDSGILKLVSEDGKDNIFYFTKIEIPDNDTDFRTFGYFAVNALLYLCANNNEIQESKKTKQTYRPSNHIKNKFSEIRQWECGYRYGAAIRSAKENTDDKSESEVISTSATSTSSSRKPMVEHVRRAHWHHYWTGKRNGERTLILHWIPPTFVNGAKCDAAVVHNVK